MEPPQTQGAKAALSYTCKLLQSLGLHGLSAEALRQAKFDGAVTRALWRALHDLVLLQLTGFPTKAGLALDTFWEQVGNEMVLEGFPWEGAQMVQQHLHAWGYPSAGLFGLDMDCIGSRTLLLALGWLMSHAGVFQRALEVRLVQLEIHAPLPPYPEDVLGTEENVNQGAAGRRSAAAYVQKVSKCCASLQGWEQVEAASHHALMLYGRVRAKLNRLAALHQTRVKHIHQASSLQQPRSPSAQTSSTASMPQTRSQHAEHAQRAPQPSGPGQAGSGAAAAAGEPHALGWGPQRQARHQAVLSPYELHLLRSPARLARHQAAVEAAAQVIVECDECLAHATVFWQWMASVAEEERKAQQQAPDAAWQSSLRGRVQEAQPGPTPLHAPPLRMLDQTSRHVTPDCLQLAERLQAEVASRLASVAQQHQLDLDQLGEPDGNGFAQLHLGPSSGAWDRSPFLKLASWRDAIRQQLPQPPKEATGAAMTDLPDDIQASLAAVQQQHQQEALQMPRLASSCTAGPLRYLHVQDQGSGVSLEQYDDEGRVFAVQDEIDRLKGMVLATAKMLARTRATNKHALRAVLEGLGGEQVFLGL